MAYTYQLKIMILRGDDGTWRAEDGWNRNRIEAKTFDQLVTRLMNRTNKRKFDIQRSVLK